MSAIFAKPRNDEQALTLSLTLALTAPEGFDGLDFLLATSEDFANRLDPATVETCKAVAAERAELYFATSAAK
jgi:hypothetical protein